VEQREHLGRGLLARRIDRAAGGGREGPERAPHPASPGASAGASPGADGMRSRRAALSASWADLRLPSRMRSCSTESTRPSVRYTAGSPSTRT
ncbi:MAG: hypothetical protein ACK559_28075, partial [bacterium]